MPRILFSLWLLLSLYVLFFNTQVTVDFKGMNSFLLMQVIFHALLRFQKQSQF